jgi:hypothetical protein
MGRCKQTIKKVPSLFAEIYHLLSTGGRIIGSWAAWCHPCSKRQKMLGADYSCLIAAANATESRSQPEMPKNEDC